MPAQLIPHPKIIQVQIKWAPRYHRQPRSWRRSPLTSVPHLLSTATNFPESTLPILLHSIAESQPPFSFLPSSWALCPCTPSDLISSAYAELPRQATALHVEFHPMPVSPACSTWPQVTTNGVRLPACSYGLISGFITSGSAPVFPGLLPCSPFKGTGHAPVSQRR